MCWATVDIGRTVGRVAKNDIEVYKVMVMKPLEDEELFYSAYRDFPYKKGDLYKLGSQIKIEMLREESIIYYRIFKGFHFGSGNWSYSSKHYSYVSRAVVDLKSKKKKANDMKQFNLEEYLKDPNKKVVTRDGRNVRIICTDRKGTEYSVVALCTMSNVSEDCYFYFPTGKMYLSADSNNDLFFAPEKKEGYINVYRDGDDYYAGGTEIYSSEAEAVSHATKKFGYVKTVKVEWEE